MASSICLELFKRLYLPPVVFFFFFYVRCGGTSFTADGTGPEPRIRPFTTLVVKLLESDADCEGIEPSYFVMTSHQTRYSVSARCVGHCKMMWSALYSMAPHSQFDN